MKDTLCRLVFSDQLHDTDKPGEMLSTLCMLDLGVWYMYTFEFHTT